jgi:hypothetical protein
VTAFTAKQLRARAIQFRDGNRFYEETADMLEQAARALDIANAARARINAAIRGVVKKRTAK